MKILKIRYLREALLGLIYAAFVVCKGVPVLRHDWAWPTTHAGFQALLTNSLNAWSSSGLGSVQPHPDTYVISSVLALIGLALGPLASLALFVFGIGFAVAAAAEALYGVLAEGRKHWPRLLAVELLALFNPWVYNETVAGHLYMILAYAGTFIVLAEVLRSKPRPVPLSLALLLVLPQLQFFLLSMIFVAFHAMFRRVWLPIVTMFALGLPMWVGIWMERADLLSTPYSLEWQRSQSVPFLAAASLRGYFPRYDSHFGIVQAISMLVIALLAILAVFLARRRRIACSITLVLFAFLIAASGFYGPLGDAYGTIVTHVVISGVFRELYDLVGFVAIGYVALLSLRTRWSDMRAMQFALLGMVLIAIAGWLRWPPSNYWLGASPVPHVAVKTAPNSRFALLPAFQPLRFEGRGSGSDPDAYDRPGNETPLNQYLARYPVNVALSELERGRSDDLAALSVSAIIERPWLDTDIRTLSYQLNGTPAQRAPGADRVRLSFTPEVTTGGQPLVGSLVNVLGAGNVFFGDAKPLSEYNSKHYGAYSPPTIFLASHASSDEARDWVDAQFDFVTHPAMGQGLGGVVTTASAVQLSVHPGQMTLVDVNGTLTGTSGTLVVRSTGGYRWIRMPRNVTSVTCHGRCLIVAQTAMEDVPPLNPPSRTYHPVNFRTGPPWLVTVHPSRRNDRVLRYNTAFDTNWTAWAGGQRLPHFRLDATVNGWLLPQPGRSAHIILVNLAAVCEVAAELVAIIWISVLCGVAIRQNIAIWNR